MWPLNGSKDVQEQSSSDLHNNLVVESLNKSLACIEFDPQGVILSASPQFLKAMGEVHKVAEETSERIEQVSHTMDEIFNGAEGVAAAINNFRTK